MGQEANEKWTAAVNLQPTLPKSDRLLEELIAEVIRDVYLTKVRAKKEEVVRQVGLRCSSERLTPPSRKAILARVRALDTREVAKARLQASEAWAHSAAGAPSTT